MVVEFEPTMGKFLFYRFAVCLLQPLVYTTINNVLYNKNPKEREWNVSTPLGFINYGLAARYKSVAQLLFHGGRLGCALKLRQFDLP